MPTTPVNNATVYGDFAGLEKLKSGAARSDRSAVREVARQFESLFARMMIKSMRAAIGKDPIFGSDQAQTYQTMFDDQLSLELTKGKGLGLADMLMRQLQHSGATGKAAAAGGAAAKHASPAAIAPRGASGTPAAPPHAAATGPTSTDPDYARKVTAVADQVPAQLATGATSSAALKFAAALPMTSATRQAPGEELSHG